MGAAEHGVAWAKAMVGNMTHQQMHDLAATKEKGLPEHKRPLAMPKKRALHYDAGKSH